MTLTLQCWFILKNPSSDEDFSNTKENLEKIMNEFGCFYLYLPIGNFSEYLKKLDDNCGGCINNGPIEYTDSDLERGMFKKRTDYSYQSEYRFAIGFCDKSETKEKIFDVGDLRDLLVVMPHIIHDETGNVLLKPRC